MVRVLIAFDKWKSCFTARRACEIAAGALRAAHPEWTLDLCPLSDGGEGFGKTLTDSAGGEWRIEEVRGPLGKMVAAGFGLVRWGGVPAAVRAMLKADLKPDDLLGIVEMATASGLDLVPSEQRDPWHSDSCGTGELLVHAQRAGARAIVLGVGGSATNDLGLGALARLGVEALDRAGRPLPQAAPAFWADMAGFRGSLTTGFPRLFIACDVTNPLLGPEGCAAVYGLQKGLRPEDVAAMDAGAAQVVRMLCAHCGESPSLCDRPGAGAAGGIAFGLCTAAGAETVSGAELVAAWADLDRRLEECDIAITGEGAFDATSLSGKGPGDVVRRALGLGKRVVVFAGRVEPALNLPAGVVARPVTPDGMPHSEAVASGAELLARAVRAMFPPGTEPGQGRES